MENGEYSRIIIARWALFGRAGLDWLFFCAVSVELMSLVLLCCQSTTSTQIQSITLPSQAERWQPLFRQPVCCAQHRNLNTHTHRSTAVGLAHKPHMLTHTQTNMCTGSKMHTHTQSCNSCWLLPLACLPHPLSFAHSFTPFQPCMGMRCLTPTNVTSAICAAQGNTAVHDSFPFLHLQACVVVFFVASIHSCL